MTSKATFIEELANASKQIEREWPAWMTEMRAQANDAENYLRQRERQASTARSRSKGEPR